MHVAVRQPTNPRRGLCQAAIVAAMSLALVGVPAAQAAPPSNDAFAAAEPITGDAGTVIASNASATVELGEPFHAGLIGGASIWFSWTSPFTGQLQIDTCGSSFDTALAMYLGSTIATLAVVGASNDRCGEQSVVTTDVLAGTQYHIAVDGSAGAVGTLALHWRRLTRPANDDYADAQQLEGTSGRATGSTLGATHEAAEPVDRFRIGGASIWYVWTAPAAGTVVFETCASAYDTIVSIYGGDSLAESSLLARSDDACGDDEDETRSLLRTVVQAGTTYRIAVDGFRRAAGDMTLTWTLSERPANDDFAAATPLPGARGALEATNVGATSEADEPAHADTRGGASVWFRWTAPRTARVAFSTCGGRVSSLVAVYSGTSVGALTGVASDSGGCSGGSVAVLDAQRGVAYSIAVDGYHGATGAFRLQWGPPPKAIVRCYVPDVRGATLSDARQAIKRRGCAVGPIRRMPSFLVARGRVLAQLPSAGKSLAGGARIRLEVSRGRR